MLLLRCFLTAGSPASSPMKSRVVEALCLLLCDKYPHPRREIRGGKSVYTSRWKLILSEYNSVRARLLNSQALLAGTNLMLYTINETTLAKWFKASSRRNEIKLLMQGLSPPQPPLTTDSVSLPPAKIRPAQQGPPLFPHRFPEVEDTTGLANVRQKGAATTLPAVTSPSADFSAHSTPVIPALTAPGPDSPAPIFSALQLPAPSPFGLLATSSSGLSSPGLSGPVVSTPDMSRTTMWRHEKKGKETRPRKYTCRVCKKPMTSEGHTQFCGQRYCPHEPGQIPKEEWLRQKREEAARRRQQTIRDIIRRQV